jgi:hypothetical protein
VFVNQGAKMSKVKSVVAIVALSVALIAQPSNACLVGASLTGFGVVSIVLGGMFTVLSNQDQAKINALYNTSALTVTGYDVGLLDCEVCGKGCTTYPYTANAEIAYTAWSNGQTVTINSTFASFCGSTAGNALSAAQQAYPPESQTPIYYPITDPSHYSLRLPQSSFGYGEVVMYTVGAAAFLMGLALMAVSPCMK